MLILQLAGPGGREGGGVWGAATDRRRVYTNIVNNDRVNFTLAPSHQTTTAGAWVALDANSGEIIWSTADPSNETAHGPVTVVNGVLFAGSVSANGPIYAMDTNTGKFCGRIIQVQPYMEVYRQVMGAFILETGIQSASESSILLGLRELHSMPIALSETPPH